MLILLSKKNVKRLVFALKVIALVLLLSLSISELYKLYHRYDFNNKSWLKDDNPSGNPLKVYTNQEESVAKDEPIIYINNKKSLLDEFRLKLERYYRSIDKK